METMSSIQNSIAITQSPTVRQIYPKGTPQPTTPRSVAVAPTFVPTQEPTQTQQLVYKIHSCHSQEETQKTNLATVETAQNRWGGGGLILVEWFTGGAVLNTYPT